MSITADLALPFWDLVRQEAGEPTKGSLDRPGRRLPPNGILDLAHSFALPCEESTGDGGALLKVLRFQTARVFEHMLLRSSLTPPAPNNSLAYGEQEPHSEAILWVREATNLPMSRVADLLGVTRPTIYSWQANGEISDANRRRLFAVREILERAMRTRPTSAALAVWLDTPRGTDGRTPFELLSSGELDRARLYALSTPSTEVQSLHDTARSPAPRFRIRPEYVAEPHPFEDDEELSRLLSDDLDD